MDRQTQAEIRAKKAKGRELDEWEKENIERSNEYMRRQKKKGRTPEGVKWANWKKRHGGIEFAVNEECNELELRSRASRPGDDYLMRLIGTFMAGMGATLWQTGKGRIIVKVPVKAKGVREGLGIKDIPAACMRCEGKGEIPNPEKRLTAEEARAVGAVTYCWTPSVTCPVCRGSGRPPQLDDEEG